MQVFSRLLQNQKIEFTPQTQWAALSAAHVNGQKIDLCLLLARELGFEPRTHRLHVTLIFLLGVDYIIIPDGGT